MTPTLTVTDAKLLPCPFCGGEAMLIERKGHWQVTCLPCTADITEPTRAAAITAWNTRTPASPTSAEQADDRKRIGELEGALVVAIAGLGYINATCFAGPRLDPGGRAKKTLNRLVKMLGNKTYDTLALASLSKPLSDGE